MASFLTPLLTFVFTVLKIVLISALSFVLLAAGIFFARYRLNPFRVTADKLRALDIKFKWYDLIRWIWVDFLERELHRGEFREYGCTFYVGRQGAGKTISVVEYLDRMKARYPDCVIVANFKYDKADYLMKDWHDLLNVRNGEAGVIFAIDEIQSEYSSASSRDFPEDLLREISQQRKQRIKIVCTSQHFARVAKPLREQAFSVVMCRTSFGRLTSTSEYDAIQFAAVTDNAVTVRNKLRPLGKRSFVQSDELRNSYDTYEKIERMKKTKFLPPKERVYNR